VPPQAPGAAVGGEGGGAGARQVAGGEGRAKGEGKSKGEGREDGGHGEEAGRQGARGRGGQDNVTGSREGGSTRGSKCA